MELRLGESCLGLRGLGVHNPPAAVEWPQVREYHRRRAEAYLQLARVSTYPLGAIQSVRDVRRHTADAHLRLEDIGTSKEELQELLLKNEVALASRR